MLVNGLERVLTARGVEATILSDKGAQTALINPDQAGYQLLHRRPPGVRRDFLCNCCQLWTRSATCSVRCRDGQPRLTRKTTSREPNCPWQCRNVSRTTLFIRLRSTARRSVLRAITRPSRAWPRSERRASIRNLSLPKVKLAASKTCLKSRGVRRRRDFPNWASASIDTALLLPLGSGGTRPPRSSDRVSGRKALAAPGAPAVDYQSAVLGGHTCTETMGPGSLENAGLKCSFHRRNSTEP